MDLAVRRRILGSAGPTVVYEGRRVESSDEQCDETIDGVIDGYLSAPTDGSCSG